MPTAVKNIKTAIACAAVSLLLLSATAVAKSYDAGTEATSDYQDAQIVEHPEPQIPPALKEECLKMFCVARFTIDDQGKAKVKLLSTSGSDEIDDITMQTLRRWKFKPAMLDGKPVASSRRIKVEFEVI